NAGQPTGQRFTSRETLYDPWTIRHLEATGIGPGFSYNQFLIDDEHPTLIHTGTYPLYEDVRQAVSEILDPGRLAYIIVPHFEADECGGMGRFVAAAPQGVL